MDEQSFDQLTTEAAAGLKGDPELYLDIKQELKSHLEDKVAHFDREGHTPEESIELAKKSFGSPLDVAAELLDANRRRMRFRSLLRLGFKALIVPIAIVLALYVGYGRFVRLQDATLMFATRETYFRLPALPFLNGNLRPGLHDPDIVHQLAGGQRNTGNILRYWKTHRQDTDSRMYYAYYAMFLEPKSGDKYVEAMRKGEQIEPQNALYNVLLARCYLHKGMISKEERWDNDTNQTDQLLDRHSFELGVAEIHKAVSKPYLQTYQINVLSKRLHAMPRPLFTEDYTYRMSVIAGELFPHLAGYRDIARKIPGCARILISEGRPAEAEALLDTWKPYVMLLISDPSDTMFHRRVEWALGAVLTEQTPSIYYELGKNEKAQYAGDVNARLTRMRKEWREGGSQRQQIRDNEMIRQHGSTINIMFMPTFGGVKVSEQELMPGRMHEYILFEEAAVQALMIIFVFLMLGTTLQGVIWLFRLRQSASVPILLMVPWKVIARSLLLGILLPGVIYWLYSRITAISGRDFSLVSGMWIRFSIEMLILGLIMLSIPGRLVHAYVRKRCTDLDIELPGSREEAKFAWKVRGGVFSALILAGSTTLSSDLIYPPMLKVLSVILAIAIMLISLKYVGRKRSRYGLYYGTLARSLAPMYAFSIILLALTVQPWLLYNEAKWVQQDTLVYGYLAKKQDTLVFTSLEERASRNYTRLLLKAIEGTDK